jgi:hypothetical protein
MEQPVDSNLIFTVPGAILGLIAYIVLGSIIAMVLV